MRPLLLSLLFIHMVAFAQQEEKRPMIPSNLDRSKVQVRGGNEEYQDQYQQSQNVEADEADEAFQDPEEKLNRDFENTASELAELQALEAEADKKIKEGKVASAGKGQKVPGFFKKMLGGLQSKMIKKLLKTNPMSHMSHDDLKASLTEKFKGGKLEPVIKKYPKLMDFVVGMIRDPEALPQMVTILDKQEKMLTYTYSFVGIFILSIILNIFAFPNAGWFKKIMFKLLITIMVPILNLGIFYVMFKKELDPTVEVAKKYLF